MIPERQEPQYLPYGGFITGNEEREVEPVFEELGITGERRTAIDAMLAPLKLKSPFHYGHSLRVGILAKNIADFMHVDPKPLFYAGLLHDIGKALVPPDTLHKTGTWTEEDRATLRPHVIDSFRLLQGAMDFTAQIIVWHHRFQKDCYPVDLPADLHEYSPGTKATIQMYGRLLMIADVWDALHRFNSKNRWNLEHYTIAKTMLDLNKDQTTLVKSLIDADILWIPRHSNLRKLTLPELLLLRTRNRKDSGGCDGIPYEDIKAELNTRPHLPNKQEGKVLRRNKKKAGRGDRQRPRR